MAKNSGKIESLTNLISKIYGLAEHLSIEQLEKHQGGLPDKELEIGVERNEEFGDIVFTASQKNHAFSELSKYIRKKGSPPGSVDQHTSFSRGYTTPINEIYTYLGGEHVPSKIDITYSLIIRDEYLDLYIQHLEEIANKLDKKCKQKDKNDLREEIKNAFLEATTPEKLVGIFNLSTDLANRSGQTIQKEAELAIEIAEGKNRETLNIMEKADPEDLLTQDLRDAAYKQTSSDFVAKRNLQSTLDEMKLA